MTAATRRQREHVEGRENEPGTPRFRSLERLAAKWQGMPRFARYGAAFGLAATVILFAGLRTPIRGDSLRTALIIVMAVSVATDGFIEFLHRASRRAAEQSARLAQESAARASAEAANRAKDEFLAMLGHELRDPLGAITAALHVLDRTEGPDERATRARHVIRRQTAHLARLVDDLLDVGRMMADKIRLDRRPIDLVDIVTRCLDTLQNAGRLEAHVITLDLRPAWVEADSVRLEQIAMNLLVNALKYTPSGGSIHLSVESEATAVVLRVCDSGMGIAPDLLPRMFDLFVQGERAVSRVPGGLGIGLSLVRHLVELHGGTVYASSDGPERGSTFTVCLPSVAADLARLVAALPARGSR